MLSLCLAACARSDRRTASDSAASAEARPPRGPVSANGPAVAAPAMPGALAKPIDAYSGDELYELTRTLTFAGSHERARHCKGSAACDAGATTLVQVSAVASQDSLAPGNVPEHGVLYVRAINKGGEEEAAYSLRAGNSLRYYMIVQRDPSGALRWRLEELETASPRRHTRIASGRFLGCGHPWTPGARADFRTCEMAERGDTVVTMGLALQVDDPPLWTSCSAGCCWFSQP
jgi:hypothetical protein